MKVLTRAVVCVFASAWAPSLWADIVGGTEVGQSDPLSRSVAAIYREEPGKGGALCTATVVASDVALTAAHCVSGEPGRTAIIFGKNVRSPDREVRPVTGVLVNHRWSDHAGKQMDQGDVALVRFGGGLPPGYEAAEPAASDSDLKRGKRVTLVGYGINQAERRTGAGVLRKTSVSVADPRSGKKEMILDQSQGSGACHGDSGGPAFVRSGRRTVVVGVTNRSYPESAPDDCAHKVVYSKVSAYYPWIEKGIQELRSRKDESPLSAGRRRR